MREILTTWVSPGAGNGTTVMYFDEEISLDIQRDALAAFWGSVDAHLTTGTTWTIALDGRLINEATGTLTGLWSGNVQHTASGTSGTNAVSNSSQAMFRWATGQIERGRFVTGRTFVPGFSTAGLANGEINAATRTALNAAAATFVQAGTGFGVWHRPINGSGGAHHVATGGTVWQELGVQRRRRP